MIIVFVESRIGMYCFCVSNSSITSFLSYSRALRSSCFIDDKRFLYCTFPDIYQNTLESKISRIFRFIINQIIPEKTNDFPSRRDSYASSPSHQHYSMSNLNFDFNHSLSMCSESDISNSNNVAPEIVSRSKDIMANVGQSVVLSCHVRNGTNAKIVWRKMEPGNVDNH